MGIDVTSIEEENDLFTYTKYPSNLKDINVNERLKESNINSIYDSIYSNPNDLLEYYRERCNEFQKDRQIMLDRIATIEVSKEELHHANWNIKMKQEEIDELELALSRTNATINQLKQEILTLQGQNKALKIQEENDRKKIQHLLALTEPICQQVSFYQDSQPVCISSSRQSIPKTYTYPSTLYIDAERMENRRMKEYPAKQHKKRIQSQLSSQSTAPSVFFKRQYNTPKSQVMRMIYMPDEQTKTLSKTVEHLQDQLDTQKKLSEDRIKTLQEELTLERAKRQKERVKLVQDVSEIEEKLKKNQKLLFQTTRDYLVLRHQSQEAERQAKEELYELKHQFETIEVERSRMAKEAMEETEAMKEVVREEGNLCAEEFRNQAVSRERDLQILKEQYAAVQDACTKRIQDLQARLTKLRSRYRSLEQRRTMEMEGFTRDVVALRRHVQHLEMRQYGRHLSAQEQKDLRKEKQYLLNANELSNEISTLQRRVKTLSTQLDV